MSGWRAGRGAAAAVNVGAEEIGWEQERGARAGGGCEGARAALAARKWRMAEAGTLDGRRPAAAAQGGEGEETRVGSAVDEARVDEGQQPALEEDAPRDGAPGCVLCLCGGGGGEQ